MSYERDNAKEIDGVHAQLQRFLQHYIWSPVCALATPSTFSHLQRAALVAIAAAAHTYSAQLVLLLPKASSAVLEICTPINITTNMTLPCLHLPCSAWHRAGRGRSSRARVRRATGAAAAPGQLCCA